MPQGDGKARVTIADKARVVEMHRQGMSGVAIAKALGLHRRTVGRVLASTPGVGSPDGEERSYALPGLTVGQEWNEEKELKLAALALREVVHARDVPAADKVRASRQMAELLERISSKQAWRKRQIR